jgi:hypothetical protein
MKPIDFRSVLRYITNEGMLRSFISSLVVFGLSGPTVSLRPGVNPIL